MDLIALWITLAALAGGCFSAVVILLARHKRTVTDETPDVVEIAHELATLKKMVRRAYMQRVRESEGGTSLDSLPLQAPPELQPVESPSASPQELKRRLRDAVFSRKH